MLILLQTELDMISFRLIVHSHTSWLNYELVCHRQLIDSGKILGLPVSVLIVVLILVLIIFDVQDLNLIQLYFYKKNRLIKKEIFDKPL